MRAHYVPEDLRRCEREGGLCGNSTGAVCISPLRHRRLFALPPLFLHPHRFLSPSPPSPPPPCSTIINCFRIPLNLFVCIILYNVHLFPLSAMFGLCAAFLAVAAVLQVSTPSLPAHNLCSFFR